MLLVEGIPFFEAVLMSLVKCVQFLWCRRKEKKRKEKRRKEKKRKEKKRNGKKRKEKKRKEKKRKEKKKKRKEKKKKKEEKNYAFRLQFNEKPRTVPGSPRD